MCVARKCTHIHTTICKSRPQRALNDFLIKRLSFSSYCCCTSTLHSIVLIKFYSDNTVKTIIQTTINEHFLTIFLMFVLLVVLVLFLVDNRFFECKILTRNFSRTRHNVTFCTMKIDFFLFLHPKTDVRRIPTKRNILNVFWIRVAYLLRIFFVCIILLYYLDNRKLSSIIILDTSWFCFICYVFFTIRIVVFF